MIKKYRKPSNTMDDIPVKIPSSSNRLLDKLRIFIRSQNKSWATEKTYIHWIRRFIIFHNKRHPKDMGNLEVEEFLEHLTVHQHCSPSTQSTALNAIVFLYKQFLKEDIGDLTYQRAKPSRKIPVVFSESEAKGIIKILNGDKKLMAKLMYGSGLRVSECLRLRIKESDTLTRNPPCFNKFSALIIQLI